MLSMNHAIVIRSRCRGFAWLTQRPRRRIGWRLLVNLQLEHRPSTSDPLSRLALLFSTDFLPN